MSRLVFFDLDGTISRRDTLLPYVSGFLLRHPWRAWRLVALLPALAAFTFGERDRGRLKGALIHAGMGGASHDEVARWTARFLPRGLFGIGYWYGVLPLHALVFQGLLRGLKRAAERKVLAGGAAAANSPPPRI